MSDRLTMQANQFQLNKNNLNMLQKLQLMNFFALFCDRLGSVHKTFSILNESFILAVFSAKDLLLIVHIQYILSLNGNFF